MTLAEPQPATPAAPLTAGALILLATPLGNLGDITLRAIEVLREVQAVICEDTRRTQQLLSALGLRRPLLSMPAFDEHRKIGPLIARLQAGARLALVSDAGSVAISDPGQLLVAAAVAAGVEVDVLPGASAVIAALQVSGLPTSRFSFFGFLPRKGADRGRALAELAALSHSAVLYESPRRLGATLTDLLHTCGDRRAAVVRELTKLHQEVARGSLSELAQRFSGDVLGEVTLVLEGAAPRPAVADDATIDAALDRHRGETIGSRALSKMVAEELGISTRTVYQKLIRSGRGSA